MQFDYLPHNKALSKKCPQDSVFNSKSGWQVTCYADEEG